MVTRTLAALAVAVFIASIAYWTAYGIAARFFPATLPRCVEAR